MPPTQPTSVGRPFRRRLVVNTASTAAGNVWSMVIMLATVPLLLRGLGTQGFGLWVLLQTFSATTGWLSLADLGVGVAMTRLVAGRSAAETRTAGRAIASGLALLSVVGAACAALLASVGPALLVRLFDVQRDAAAFRLAVAIFGINVLAEIVLRGCCAALEGLQRVDVARAAEALRRTIVAAATVAAALAGTGLVGVAVASTVATTVAAGVAVLLLSKHLAGFDAGPIRPRRADVAELLRYGTTVGALNATGVLHRVMDKLIVGTLFGATGVALIEVATQVQNGASAILSATSYAAMSSSPWLQARGDADALRQLLLRGTRYCLLATLPVVALAAVLADPLVRLWVGDAFAEASGLAVVALLYIAAASPLQVGQNLLQGIGAAGLVLRAAAVAVVVNLVASVFLARSVGLVGVLLGTLAGVVVLLPPLTTSVLRATDTTLRTFMDSAVVPAAVPALAVGLSAGVAAALVEGPDVVRVGVACIAGGLAFIPPALRWGIDDRDLDWLRARVSARRARQ